MDNGERSSRTIFHQLLQPDVAEGHVPIVQDLIDEDFAILGAEADTTGNALTIASYNIVANPGIYQKATKELKAAFPDPSEMKFMLLEKLPYLVSYPSDIDIEALLMVVDRGYQRSSSVGLAFCPIRVPLTQLVCRLASPVDFDELSLNLVPSSTTTMFLRGYAS